MRGLLLLLLLGCEGESTRTLTGVDAEPDVEAVEADATPLDAEPDAAFDAEAADATLDAAPEPDATPDAAPDATVDATLPPSELSCVHQWPPAVRARTGAETDLIFGRVRAQGAVEAQLGYGPRGTQPDATWRWTEAAPNPQCDGCADERESMARLVVPQPGDYDLAFRFRTPGAAWAPCDRAEDPGYQSAHAARLRVEDAPGLIVATANLRCLRDDWPARAPLLIQDIGDVDPDLIALQELCVDDAQDSLEILIEGLRAWTGRDYTVLRAQTHVTEFAESIALLSAHPPMASALTPEPTLDLPPGVFQRKAVLARLQLEGQPILIAGTHLSHHDQAPVRSAQLAALRLHLSELRAPGEALLIMGDLNEAPDAPGVAATIAAGYTDLWATLQDAPTRTYPAGAPEAQIDHILLDGAWAHGVRIERFLDRARDGVYPSDHYALWARIEVRP